MIIRDGTISLIPPAGAVLAMNDPVLAGWAGRPSFGMPVDEAVRRWLDYSPVFGADLAQDPSLATELSHALAALRERGVIAVVSAWLAAR